MSAQAQAPARRHNEVGVMAFPPLVHLIWGAILLLGNIAGNMMQVQSTQAWFLGGSPNWRLDFSIWAQWPQFFSGGMNPHQIVAFIASWGAQFILMTSKLGTSFIQANATSKHATAAHHSDGVIREARIRLGVWNAIAWLIIVVDSMTDWNFASGIGFWQQAFFCSVTFLATFYFGSWGILHVTAGFNRMKD